jgi:hypothetical protein
MYNNLIVLLAPRDGRHDDLNDWYTWVHIRDVMRLSPVMIAAQRFRRAAEQLLSASSGRYPQPYLAIYENTNPERLTADHAPQLTPEMPISDAVDTNSICEAYYDTLVSRTKTPGQFPKSDLICERIEAGAGGPEFENWYVEKRFAALMQVPGVVSGFAGKECPHQMLYVLPRPGFTCVYRTTDLTASLKAWPKFDPPMTVGADAFSIDCYTPLIERVTAIQVREPDPVSAETAKRKRAELGDKVMGEAPSHLRDWDKSFNATP